MSTKNPCSKSILQISNFTKELQSFNLNAFLCIVNSWTNTMEYMYFGNDSQLHMALSMKMMRGN